MRKFGMNNVIIGLNNVIASPAKQSLLAIFLTIALVACGDDKGTSAPSDEDSSSSWSEAIGSSSSKKGDAGKTSSCSSKVSSSSSQKIASTSSSSWQALSSTPRNDGQVECREQPSTDAHDRDAESCATRNDVKSSSSVKTISSSSSVILSSSSKQSSSSSKEIATSSSSSRNDVSSSSEYVPFDHSKTHANASKVGKDAYKQFTDPRNGRSYYYIKIIGKDYIGDKDSVTIMAENLNIGEMVLGKDDQNDDSKIERYCYNNDTTLCDEFGGLYQWAEMMQLPSRCNTESCADLIEENHRGICPEGWRLMTDLDFYIAWHAETNSYGIRGTRSSYGFAGNNYSGLSLTGAGKREKEGGFARMGETVYWYYPVEDSYDKNLYAHFSYVSAITDNSPSSDNGDEKTYGLSVRCVKLE